MAFSLDLRPANGCPLFGPLFAQNVLPKYPHHVVLRGVTSGSVGGGRGLSALSLDSRCFAARAGVAES